MCVCHPCVQEDIALTLKAVDANNCPTAGSAGPAETTISLQRMVPVFLDLTGLPALQSTYAVQLVVSGGVQVCQDMSGLGLADESLLQQPLVAIDNVDIVPGLMG